MSTSDRWHWTRPAGGWTWLLFLLFLPAVPIYFLIAWGVLAANRSLRSKDPLFPDDPRIAGLQTARTLVGFAVVAVLYVVHVDRGVDQLTEDMGTKAVLGIAVSLVALATGTACFAARTPDPSQRRELLARAGSRSLPALLIYAVAAAVFFALASVDAPSFGARLAVAAAGGFLVGFMIRGTYLVLKSVFAAGDVHPLLPPVLAPVIAWTLAAVEILGPGSLPLHLRATTAACGAAAVTLLSVAEARRLQTDHGVTFPRPRRGS
ncbi:hypothetical protein [Glycomyces rhizosphaerae]|uniref:Uncharacterized protein n=1 Tax=Glycomyces rhizosphaerae TaxID=2054422 RepID=A0ABV7PVV1_9ACTN